MRVIPISPAAVADPCDLDIARLRAWAHEMRAVMVQAGQIGLLEFNESIAHYLSQEPRFRAIPMQTVETVIGLEAHADHGLPEVSDAE